MSESHQWVDRRIDQLNSLMRDPQHVIRRGCEPAHIVPTCPAEVFRQTLWWFECKRWSDSRREAGLGAHDECLLDDVFEDSSGYRSSKLGESPQGQSNFLLELSQSLKSYVQYSYHWGRAWWIRAELGIRDDIRWKGYFFSVKKRGRETDLSLKTFDAIEK